MTWGLFVIFLNTDITDPGVMSTQRNRRETFGDDDHPQDSPPGTVEAPHRGAGRYLATQEPRAFKMCRLG
ncbi:hypothetical protein GCM10018790_62190 [Kitasatospora xanthocidica]|nr:hypothetical protein GCM10018790_62190 [Kitasatospora xanthocidica]